MQSRNAELFKDQVESVLELAWSIDKEYKIMFGYGVYGFFFNGVHIDE